MQPIPGKEKPQQSSNVFYGVDVTDKKAVQQEYNRLKEQHRLITIFTVVILGILAVVVMDFVRVNMMDARPIIALGKKVDNGILYRGFGYQVLYCENSGERYAGVTVTETCSEVDANTFEGIVYGKLLEYGDKTGLISFNKVSSINITNITFDEKNDQEGEDYFVEAYVGCAKRTDKRCIDLGRDYGKNFYFYVRMDRYNDVYSVVAFKTSGERYNELVKNYAPKVKEYLKSNTEDGVEIDEDNLKSYSIELIKNPGTYSFRGVDYYESYLVEINYLCKDGSNTCIKSRTSITSSGEYTNNSFYMSMFIREDDEIGLMGPQDYFDL